MHGFGLFPGCGIGQCSNWQIGRAHFGGSRWGWPTLSNPIVLHLHNSPLESTTNYYHGTAWRSAKTRAWWFCPRTRIDHALYIHHIVHLINDSIEGRKWKQCCCCRWELWKL
jgi:hypothetical protein